MAYIDGFVITELSESSGRAQDEPCWKEDAPCGFTTSS